MSGLKVGTRLDQLLALRSRLDQEIAVERRKEALAVRRYETRHAQRRVRSSVQGVREADGTTALMLDRLGVTSLEVKQWGVREGFLLGVARGRVSLWLVNKYAEAHGQGVTA